LVVGVELVIENLVLILSELSIVADVFFIFAFAIKFIFLHIGIHCLSSSVALFPS